ncbi:MAG: ABC transporter substrate-binding protein [Candidatus Schekmanbacteria bacterium]|nr:ABC transporter substrate-binding protein [Candidatus Schekmanbacteria bacterium]
MKTTIPPRGLAARLVLAVALAHGVLALGAGRAQEGDLAPNAPASATPRWGGHLAVAVPRSAYSLDPLWAYDAASRMVSAQIHEGLFEYDARGAIVACLATGLPRIAVERGPNGVAPHHVAEVSVRGGVRFHDGTQFAARDAAAALSRLITAPDVPSRGLFRLFMAARATAPQTLVIDLARVSTPEEVAGLLARTEAAVPQVEEVKRFGKGYGKTTAVGTGPFALLSWEKGKAIVLRRNASYWRLATASGAAGEETVASDHRGHLPYLDRLSFAVLESAEQRVQALAAGEVRLLEHLEHGQHRLLAGVPGVAVEWGAGTSVVLLYFNVAAPPFADRETRVAMAQLLDRPKIARELFAGHAAAAVAVTPRGSTLTEAAFPFAPGAATSSLARHAMESGAAPLAVELLTNELSPFPEVAREIAEMWRRAGLQVVVTALNKKALLKRLYYSRSPAKATAAATPGTGVPAPAFAVALEDWDDFRGDTGLAVNLFELFHSQSKHNKTGLADAELDANLEKLAADAEPPAAARQLLAATEGAAMATAAIVPIAFPEVAWAYDRQLQRVWRRPGGGAPIFRDAWLENNK